MEEYAQRCAALALPSWWLTSTADGHLAVPLSPKSSQHLALAEAIDYVDRLVRHQDRPGFDHFIEGWRNGPQMRHSLAELICLENLMAAKSHREYAFGPLVTPGGAKRADILWISSRGTFLVEVKALYLHHRDFASSLERLADQAKREIEALEPSLVGLRLDIVTPTPSATFQAQLHTCLQNLRADLALRQRGAKASCGPISVTIRARDEAPVSGPGIRNLMIKVGATSTTLDFANAYATVSLELGPRTRQAFRDIVKTARKKLRGGVHPAILWLEVEGNLDVAQQYFVEAATRETFARIPLMVATDRKNARFVYRHSSPAASSSLDDILEVLAL